jgi:hypothetical protein
MAIEFDASHVGSPNFVLGERAVWIFRVHQETKGFCHWLQNLSQAALQIFVPEGGICYEDQISMVEFIAATRRVGDPLIFLNRNRPRYALGTHDSPSYMLSNSTSFLVSAGGLKS